MSEIPWPQIIGAVCLLGLAVVGLLLLLAHRRDGDLGDTAAELAKRHRDDARKQAEADYARAMAAGESAVAEADAIAERRVADADSLADHLRDLDANTK